MPPLFYHRGRILPNQGPSQPPLQASAAAGKASGTYFLRGNSKSHDALSPGPRVSQPPGAESLCGLWGAEGAAWGSGRRQGSSTQTLGHSRPHAHPGEEQLDGAVEPSFAGHGNETKLLPPS